MGFSAKDRLDLIEMMAVSENYLSTKRIDQWFDPGFFKPIFGSCGIPCSLFEMGVQVIQLDFRDFEEQ